MGVLVSGAAYVPVDADDPDERARLVFDESDVAAVVGNGLVISGRRGRARGGRATGTQVEPSDDAWVIFTSGSTGTPKGVAVDAPLGGGVRDAESLLFCRSGRSASTTG